MTGPKNTDNKCKIPKPKGAPKGNKNALGNSGGCAPYGNKNALTTGESEKIMFDSFDETELKLIKGIKPNAESLLLEEIKILCVRERRMLRRIDELYKKNPKGMSIEGIVTVNNTHLRENSTADRDTKTTKIEPVLNQIHKIEEALTRVQARKQVCIDMLYKMKNDKKRFELENW